MPTLLLVRHGETDWNRSGQIMGERPVPLNDAGEHQAQRLAAVLESHTINAIFSSPVKRAKQTADILASSAKLPVTEDRALTEIDVGEWVGRYWKDLTDDLVRRNFYSKPADTRPPGGETLHEVQTRAVGFIDRAISETTGASQDAQLLFVSHADVVRAVLAHYLRLDLQTIRQVRIDHASLTAIELNGSLTSLLFLNYTPQPAGLKEKC